MDKFLQTVQSRKAVALALAFVLAVLNRVLGWDMKIEEILVLVAPLFAWAGIEGLMDAFKIKNGAAPPAAEKKKEGDPPCPT